MNHDHEDEMRCCVCNRRAPPSEVGWERDRTRDWCPSHRKERPKTMTTIGDLLAAKATR